MTIPDRRIMAYEEHRMASRLSEITDGDSAHFYSIMSVICECHLTSAEQMMVGWPGHVALNESWFSDLKDKASRGVLKVRSDAGKLLTAVAQKAKDVLEFLKSLASQIVDSVMRTFRATINQVKSQIVPKSELLGLYTAYLAGRAKKIKGDVQGTGRILAFVFTELPSKLVSALVASLRGVFGEGRNEGFAHLCDGFLLEDNSSQGEKKSFLQRLGDKVASLPPFTLIPKAEEMLKQGIGAVRDSFGKFLGWLDKPGGEMYKDTKINLYKNPFLQGLRFLFDMLEIYLVYLYNKKVGNLKKIQKSLQNADKAVIDQLVQKVRDMSLEKVYQSVGLSPADVVSQAKSVAQRVPYVGSLISIIKVLGVCVGVYQVVQPLLDKNAGKEPKKSNDSTTTDVPPSTNSTGGESGNVENRQTRPQAQALAR